MFGWVVFFTWLNLTLTKKRTHLSRKAAAAETLITGHLADTMGNIAVVKSFANENAEHKTHWKLSETQAHKKYLSWVQAIKNDAVHGILMVGLQAVVLVMSIIGVMENQISLGILLLIQVYVNQLIGELWNLSNISRNIEQNLSDAAEMTELLEIQIEINDPEKPKKFSVTGGSILFDHVDFAHEDNDDDALFQNFNLKIKSGEKVGLVGHSGSGKTTLTRLLLRFSDVDKGAITIDGQDIRSVAQSDLRSRIAYVPQEPLLVHRSLEENIAYGLPGADKKAVAAAAKNAKAAEFIDDLPKGYDTLVGERGVKLSGGQRQRIAIARAMLKNAPILVLDEATSALDSESEVLIQDALWKLMEGRTAIVIAHRLSTIQKMDRIVVMDNGNIAEEGTHKELLRKNGIYANLWKHQSGGFLEDNSNSKDEESSD
jgi:ATP-binding cassette subfamily B protein